MTLQEPVKATPAVSFARTFALTKLEKKLIVLLNFYGRQHDRVLYREPDLKSGGHRLKHPRRPGAVSGGGEKCKRARKKSGEEKSRSFFARIFSPPFTLFPALTNCPWVSEDEALTT